MTSFSEREGFTILPWKLSSAYLANILIFSGIEDVFTKNSPAQNSVTKSAFHWVLGMFAFIHDIYKLLYALFYLHRQDLCSSNLQIFSYWFIRRICTECLAHASSSASLLYFTNLEQWGRVKIITEMEDAQCARCSILWFAWGCRYYRRNIASRLSSTITSKGASILDICCSPQFVARRSVSLVT